MKFFCALYERKLYSQYAEVLDWLLSDGKFDKKVWDNKNKVQAFTKAIHKMEGFSTERFIYKAKKDIIFPDAGAYRRTVSPSIYMSKGESESRDLVRHIRNGIAHGNVQIYAHPEQQYVIELLDYGKEGKQEGSQTAYLVMPLSYLKSIYDIYHSKEAQWKTKKHS